MLNIIKLKLCSALFSAVIEIDYDLLMIWFRNDFDLDSIVNLIEKQVEVVSGSLDRFIANNDYKFI